MSRCVSVQGMKFNIILSRGEVMQRAVGRNKPMSLGELYSVLLGLKFAARL